jgi:hypothetical protein
MNIRETHCNLKSDIQENGVTEVVLVIKHGKTVRNEKRSVSNEVHCNEDQ